MDSYSRTVFTTSALNPVSCVKQASDTASAKQPSEISGKLQHATTVARM